MSSSIRCSTVAVTLVTIASVGFIVPAHLAAQTRSGAPELNLDYERFTLDNGLRVIVHEDRKAPVVAVSMWYHVGSRNEPPGQTGFAHLFEHLMLNGSEHYDGEWFEPLQRVGATNVNGTTSLDRTNYFQTVPTPALDLVLWMESDRMGHLLNAVTEEKLDNQRGVVQNERRQRDNEPYGRVDYNLYAGLFPPGHPYRHLPFGSMEDLDAAALDDVHQWFRDYYGPNNAVLALAGDIDPATARRKVDRFFGDIPAGPDVDTIETWLPARTANTREVQHDEVPAIAVHRAWAVPGRSTRERALLDLAAAVLGRGRNARLYLDLVRNQQRATSVGTGVGPYELASVFDLSVRLNPGEPVSVANESIDRILDEFLEKGPTEEELARAITGINAQMVRGLESVDGQASVLAEGELYARDPLFVEQYLEWTNSATATEVRDEARTYLSTGWHQVDVVPAGRYAASESGVDRSTGLPDVPADMPTLRFPEVRTGRLASGLEVLVAERNAVPIVELSIQFDAGYAADAGGRAGAAAFAMTMLETGTVNRDALEIAAEEERLGANLSAGSDLDASWVSLSALRSDLEASIGLWADVIRNATFEEEEVERLRGRRMAAIAQEKAQPFGLALRLLPPAIYGAGHAYGVPFTGSGTEASIASITRGDLVDFRSRWLRPDNAKIFVAGDTTLDAIVPILDEAFGDWSPPGGAPPPKNISEVALPTAPRVILIDLPGSPQSLIFAGHLAPPLGSERDVAIEAMVDVLGDEFTARINMNLREDKGWAYFTSAQFADAKGQRLFVVLAPVQADRTGDALVELIMELDAIQGSRPITDVERARVIAGLTRGLPGRFETADAVLSSVVTSDRYGRRLDYPASLTERYQALRLEDLQSAARDVVQPDSLTWLIVGDLGAIRDQVEAVGIAPIEVWNVDGEPVQ